MSISRPDSVATTEISSGLRGGLQRRCDRVGGGERALHLGRQDRAGIEIDYVMRARLHEADARPASRVVTGVEGRAPAPQAVRIDQVRDLRCRSWHGAAPGQEGRASRPHRGVERAPARRSRRKSRNAGKRQRCGRGLGPGFRQAGGARPRHRRGSYRRRAHRAHRSARLRCEAMPSPRWPRRSMFSSLTESITAARRR